MPNAPKQIVEQLGIEGTNLSLTNLQFNDFPAEAQVVAKGTPIFPRLDVKAEVEFIKSKMTANEKKKGRKAMAEAKKKPKKQHKKRKQMAKSQFGLMSLTKLN